jgi:hypothetical protein
VLGVAATRLTSASLVPGGELCASTAAEPASAGLSCRGGRTFSARSRAHSGPTSDASSPAAFRPIPRCGHGFLAADLDRFHRCRVERQRFPRSETPSIDKEPGRLFTLVSSVFRNGTSDHDASSPIADSPRRARPCPPLSAATESGFLDRAPLADFCNHFTEHGHTERATIPRTKLAVSALFAAPAGPRLRAARHREALLEPPGWRPKTPAAPAGKVRDSFCARWRQRPSRMLAEHLLSPTGRARDLIASRTSNRPTEARFRPAARTVEVFAGPRCLRPPGVEAGALTPA